MRFHSNQIQEIKDLIRVKISNKLTRYQRETTSMPFLSKIMQDPEKVAAYSFIHSISTMLGMSIYEKAAKIIATKNFDIAQIQYKLEGTISDEENAVIANIMQNLRNRTRIANKDLEMKEILQFKSKIGRPFKSIADLFLKKNNTEYFIEIKTAKPNIDVFYKSKQKLLEWVALRKKPVITILAIPYNPYHPNPYNRFTNQGFFEEKKELFVAENFWNFLGGEGTYRELLNLFDEVSQEFKDIIQNKIREVVREKYTL